MREKAGNISLINLMPYLRVVLGISLLGVLIYKVDFGKIAALLSKLDIIYFFLALFLTGLALVLSAFRWQVVLRAQGFFLPFGDLFLLYLEGLFFNNFLPSSIGGDAVRFVELGKKIRNYSVSFSSVVGERVLSSAALGFISSLSALFMIGALKKLLPFIFLILLICLALVLLLFYAPQVLIRKEGKLVEKYGIKDISRQLLLIKNWKVIAKVLLLSCLFQLTLVLMNWLLFYGLGAKLSPVYYLVFIPITQAVAMLPLSFNGLGIREGSYVFLFGYAGVAKSISLTAALSFLFVVTIFSLAGGLSFAFKR